MVGTPKFSGSFSGGKVVPNKPKPSGGSGGGSSGSGSSGGSGGGGGGSKPSPPSSSGSGGSSNKPSGGGGSSGGSYPGSTYASQPNAFFKGTPGTSATDSSGNKTTIGAGGERIQSGGGGGGGGGGSKPSPQYINVTTITGTKTAEGKPIPTSQQTTAVYYQGQKIGNMVEGYTITDPKTGQGGLYYQGQRISDVTTEPRQPKAPTQPIQPPPQQLPQSSQYPNFRTDYKPSPYADVKLEPQYVKPSISESVTPDYVKFAEPPTVKALPERPKKEIVSNWLTDKTGDIPRMFGEGAEVFYSKSKDVRYNAFQSAGFSILYGATKFTEGASDVVFHPVQTGKGILTFIKDVVTNPVGTVGEVAQQIKTDPIGTVSYMVGQGKVIGVVGKTTARVGKDIYVTAKGTIEGKGYIPPESVFVGKSIKTGTGFKTAETTKQALTQFEKGKEINYVYDTVTGKVVKQKEVIVSHASPKSISGNVVKEMPAKFQQDPGVYTAPKGEVSTQFLKISPSSSYSFSLNPFSEGTFGVPTVTEIATRRVVTYPKEVLKSKGFESTKIYQQANIGKGQAYITKRSQIGRGEAPRQGYLGTRETEAVIGVGEKLGKSQVIGYTKVLGRKVLVKRTKLLTTQELKTAQGKTITSKELGTKLSKEQKVLSSLSSKKVSPPLAIYSKSITTPRKEISKPEYTSKTPISSVTYKVTSSKPYYSRSEYSAGSSRGGYSGGSSIGGGSSGGGGSSIDYPPYSPPGSPPYSPPGSPPYSPPGSPPYSPPKTPPYSPPGTPPKYPPRKPPITPYLKKEYRKKKGRYRVEIRRRGLFKTEGIFETEQQARRMGELKTLSSASASFRVKGLEGTTVKTVAPSQRYYVSQKEPGVVIQKAKYRISSPGEKREITYRGIFASKQKRAGRLF